MAKITFDYSKAAQFVSAADIDNIKAETIAAKDVLVGRTGAGNDFLGWIDLPVNYDKEEFARIKASAAKIQMYLLLSVSVAHISEPERQ